MTPFVLSFLTITLAEFGDKSQLVTLYLAKNGQRTSHIFIGMVAASLCNHYLAAWGGSELQEYLGARAIALISGCIFLVIGAFHWRYQDSQGFTIFKRKLPPVLNCFLLYFVAESADKTQLATATLAAYHDVMLPVILGASLGMVLANIPAVYLGRKFGSLMPLKRIRQVSAIFMMAVGIMIIAAELFS